ncbi:hypothetical protein TNCV_796181 [Trichonephila clavipes]|nr:hypothetical protein TNCV_796181 [Trichonephila clavipes]
MYYYRYSKLRPEIVWQAWYNQNAQISVNEVYLQSHLPLTAGKNLPETTEFHSAPMPGLPDDFYSCEMEMKELEENQEANEKGSYIIPFLKTQKLTRLRVVVALFLYVDLILLYDIQPVKFIFTYIFGE